MPAADPLSRRRLLAAGLAVLAAAPAGAAGCAGDPGPARRLTLGTGPKGGPYNAFGEALADAVAGSGHALALDPVRTSASVDNLRRIADGALDLALSTADAAEDALLGRDAFIRPIALTALARVYVNYTHLVVPAAGPAKELRDLAGRPVAVGAPGSGAQVVATRLLRAAGLEGARAADEQRLSLGESVRRLRGGAVQGLFWSGGVPTPALADLARDLPLRLLPLEKYVQPLRERYGPAYTAVTIPAGVYGLRAPVGTVGTGNYLVARPEVPDGAARDLLAVLFDRRHDLLGAVTAGARLEPRFAISTGGVPLHPGASAYYRSTYG